MQNNNLGSSPLPEVDPTMQILHPFAGSVQQYLEQLDDPDQHRPAQCPQCQVKHPLTAHGFYTRTLVDSAFDGLIRVRRYLCEACRRTVSLLPEFALPYLRSSVTVIALWLLVRLLPASSGQAAPPPMPYQRGQFWVRRFRSRAEALCVALAARTKPATAPTFVHRALTMLESTGWIPAHRFLFADLRQHLLGWPPSLIPDGCRVALGPDAALA
jgi:transposase-like protein